MDELTVRLEPVGGSSTNERVDDLGICGRSTTIPLVRRVPRMSLTKTIGLVAATTFASVAFGAVETSNDTLAQIAELRAELASIKAQNGGEQWLTEQRATQIRGIVQDVLADSETRQSLQASGATSGYNSRSTSSSKCVSRTTTAQAPATATRVPGASRTSARA